MKVFRYEVVEKIRLLMVFWGIFGPVVFYSTNKITEFAKKILLKERFRLFYRLLIVNFELDFKFA